eukprot:TRINITY_DN3105_c0_g1_i1.p1 TRINITY_DN3105_c0_g1~~TRINITY_DN3105_c0_g1_i1.p1  ORF type:complete len:474 (+),score=129.21 TRINITY_DN3105_c0_g1_i1:62-1483(+)
MYQQAPGVQPAPVNVMQGGQGGVPAPSPVSAPAPTASPSPAPAPEAAPERESKRGISLFKRKKKPKEDLQPSTPQQGVTRQDSEYSAGGDTDPSHSRTSNQTPQPPTPTSNAEWKLFDNPRKKVTIDDFNLQAELGRGSFGEVFKVIYKSKRKLKQSTSSSDEASPPGSPGGDEGGKGEKAKSYALKIMSKARICKPKEVLSERSVLQHLNHPFVVQLVGAFQTSTKLCLILTYLPHGNLRDRLKQCVALSPQSAAFTSACILLALEYLHANKIIYRDLKPENIVVDELGYPVVTDMGLAKELKEQMAHTCCGTPLYTAPEVLTSRDAGYTTAVDWWSFGIILAEMLQGVPPFYSNNSKAVFQLVLHRPPQLAPPVVDIGKQIITELLAKDPARRLTDPAVMRQRDFYTAFGFDWDCLRGRKYKSVLLFPPEEESKLMATETPLSDEQKAQIVRDIKADPQDSQNTNYLTWTL